MNAERDQYFSPQDEDDFGEWLDQFPQPTEDELEMMAVYFTECFRDFTEKS